MMKIQFWSGLECFFLFIPYSSCPYFKIGNVRAKICSPKLIVTFSDLVLMHLNTLGYKFEPNIIVICIHFSLFMH